jgi:hypothetical protein
VLDDTAVPSGAISGCSLDITTSETTPAQGIADLQTIVSGLRLPKGLTTALNSKLNDARPGRS